MLPGLVGGMMSASGFAWLPENIAAQRTKAYPHVAQAYVQLASNGDLLVSVDGPESGDSNGRWLDGGVAGDFEAYFTLISGTLTFGSSGVWVNASGYIWTLDRTPVGIANVTGTLQIRRASDHVVVVTPKPVDMTAIVETG